MLLACGPGTEAEPQGQPSDQDVKAQSCVQLYRPQRSSYFDSFPMREDGQVGGCETGPDCIPVCWGQESPYYVHQDYFYCTYCPSP
ncbi:hypothetical protein [Corallococcus llansteffanensis]|uniref:Uncharacterized protein n=1 Tax=Corallococcus llansteffanensis TaxID=2316731 RepID=A0A3A8PA63_9BACT|nr:hypothetical protein [Corallococcus llansteffanensis]RKH49352.1 hypothetical protein D7V93_32025 [Corallococcus llansteffanensis]